MTLTTRGGRPQVGYRQSRISRHCRIKCMGCVACIRKKRQNQGMEYDFLHQSVGQDLEEGCKKPMVFRLNILAQKI